MSLAIGFLRSRSAGRATQRNKYILEVV